MAKPTNEMNLRAVRAARMVQLEVLDLLRQHADDVVLVGGSVPELLMPSAREAYIGTIDVDLAVNTHMIDNARGYLELIDLLQSHGYTQSPTEASFTRTVSIDGVEMSVRVDLLTPQFVTENGLRKPVTTAPAFRAPGCDLAFKLNRKIEISGLLPDGRPSSVSLQVATIAPFLVMKSLAMDGRSKQKDAWDIVWCLRNYPGGVSAVAAEIRPHLGDPLVEEAMDKLRMKFASPEAQGPAWVAQFEEVQAPQEQARIRRDAYERVSHMLELLAE